MVDHNAAEIDDFVDDRRGSRGRGSSILWWILGLGALGCFVVCLGCAGLGYYFMPKMTMTPPEVAKVGDEILKVDLPPGFEGRLGMSMNNFAFKMKMACFEHTTGKGTVSLIAMDMDNVKEVDVDEMRRGFVQGQRGGGGGNDKFQIEPIHVDETETIERTIGGQTVKFEIRKGEALSTKRKLNQVEAVIKLPKGFRSLQLQLEESEWDEEAIHKMIESVDLPAK